MIARTIEVTAELTSNIIEATASLSERTIEATAGLTTEVRHYESEYPDYEGGYVVAPDWEPQTFATNNKVMHSDVTVQGIYINSAQNPQGGNTVYIGGQLNG